MRHCLHSSLLPYESRKSKVERQDSIPVSWCGVRTAGGGEGHQRWIVDCISVGTTILLLLNSLKSGQRRSHERPFADSRFTDLRRFTGVGRLTIRLTFDNRASRLGRPLSGWKVKFPRNRGRNTRHRYSNRRQWVIIAVKSPLYSRAAPTSARLRISGVCNRARIFLIMRGRWTLRQVPSQSENESFYFLCRKLNRRFYINKYSKVSLRSKVIVR